MKLLLLSLLLLSGCASDKGYEIRLFLNEDATKVTGYVKIDEVKHPITITYDD